MNRTLALRRLARHSQLPKQLVKVASVRASSGTAAESPQQARHGHLPGVPSSAITTKMHFFDSVLESKSIPTYRVLDGSGVVIEGAEVPEIDKDFARRVYENMMLLPALDTVLYNVQRQGKISFYMTSYGEEASVVGSAAALADTDEVLGQYREMGVLLWRNFGIDRVMAQCFGNEDDKSTKGRQMPVHFSSPDHHFHTISSPLATQIPQAAGVAYALKRVALPQRTLQSVILVMVLHQKAIFMQGWEWQVYSEDGWWSHEEEEALKAKQKREVMEGFKKAEAMKRPPLTELFTDMYEDGNSGEPWTLTEQRAELKAYLDKYGKVWEPYVKELPKFK
ncbi:unnamed protein product [Rhizoctonia solani]|uniref:2-oxoisovalerate dehydrogenase subunit alpha n=1 Tax=Rhizoctonia solani TaxID=456999 RepID=A0A8H3D3B4_9AGAM|nr:unnamed protein product [Rhizoctonia solani]